jgi:hypothetical protein
MADEPNTRKPKRAGRVPCWTRMNGAFGRGTGFANGVLFAAYHLHVPWAIPARHAHHLLPEALPERLDWIAVHSAQGVVIVIIVLALVL